MKGGAFASALFLIGVLTTLALATAAAWADFEGLSYFATGAGYDSFSGLHCPILISRAETGRVSATFENQTDQEIEPYYQVEISGLAASRQLEGQITVPAHASREITWSVDAGDIDLRYFVFVKLDVLPYGGHATREATCGILVTDIAGMSGGQTLTVALAVGLLGMVAGLLLPEFLTKDQGVRSDAPPISERRRISRALGVSSACALLGALAGWWLAALVLLVVSVLLMIMVMLRYAIT